jgi:hypothetical protein
MIIITHSSLILTTANHDTMLNIMIVKVFFEHT